MSQINKFNTQHISNYLSYSDGNIIYAAWMHAASRFPNESTQATAKRVLGKQNYCWNGSVRHWIWEREFQFQTKDGRLETCRWRLFASSKGFALEVEDKFNRPNGSFIKQAAYYALDNFIDLWQKNDSLFQSLKYKEYIEIFS